MSFEDLFDNLVTYRLAGGAPKYVSYLQKCARVSASAVFLRVRFPCLVGIGWSPPGVFYYRL